MFNIRASIAISAFILSQGAYSTASTPFTISQVGASGFTFSINTANFNYAKASVSAVTPGVSISTTSNYQRGPNGRLLFDVSSSSPRTFSVSGTTGPVIIEGCLNGSVLPGATCQNYTLEVLGHNLAVGSITSNTTNTQLPFAYTSATHGRTWSEPVFMPTSIEGTPISNIQINASDCASNGLDCIAGGSFMYDPDSPDDLTPVIYKSTDGGANWSDPIQLAYPDVSTSYRLTQIGSVACSHEGDTCIAVGNSTIEVSAGNEQTRILSYVSTDGGLTWSSSPTLVQQPESYFTSVLYSISCDISAQNCVGTGYGQELANDWIPLVYHTRNGGRTWTGPVELPREADTTAIMYGIACSTDLNTCSTVGELGDFGETSRTPVVYTTTTGGTTPAAWTQSELTPPTGTTSSLLLSVSCDRTGQVCSTVGQAQSIGDNFSMTFNTRDGGTTWSTIGQLLTPPEGTEDNRLGSIHCNALGHICIAGGYGTSAPAGTRLIPYSYTSLDGGRTWQSVVTMETSDAANLASDSGLRAVSGAR